MANEPNDSKVVQGGDVQFDSGNTPRADTLEGAVNTALAGDGSTSLVSWEVENLVRLGGALIPLLVRISASDGVDNSGSLNVNVNRIEFNPLITRVIPYVVSARRAKDYVARLSTENIDATLLRPFLEGEYGPELAETGIYEALGLLPGNTVSMEDLCSYFPEFKIVADLDKMYVNIYRKPLQALLALPVGARPFFTGAVCEAKLEEESGLSETWHFPLSLKEVLTYAKKVNQLPKVKEYMDILCQMREQ